MKLERLLEKRRISLAAWLLENKFNSLEQVLFYVASAGLERLSDETVVNLTTTLLNQNKEELKDNLLPDNVDDRHIKHLPGEYNQTPLRRQQKKGI